LCDIFTKHRDNLTLKTILTFILGICIYSICVGQATNEILLTKKLDSAFAKVFSNNEPGGSIFIQKGDKILYNKSFGLADLKTNKKFTDQTITNIGSISKTFVAYGILILQNQGKLSIEDSIIKFFPNFKNKELASKIKIKHLLTHTSGLPDNRNVEKDSIYYLTAKDWENFKPLLQTDSLEFEQGSLWNYSNPAYNGLALIIEKVSKMKWQEFIRKNIFLPAKMKTSKITDGNFPSKNVAHSYRKIDDKFEEYDYGEYPTFCAAGNGGVWSSISELRKYILALNNCSFANCSTIELSKKVWRPENWKSKNEPVHSMVWFVHRAIFDDFGNEKCNVIEHSGDQAGFKSHLILIPEKDITIIWLTNNDKFITGAIRKILIELNYIE
jgi:CubicO group peptidase (beta-lactamase class C family)